MTVPKTMTCSRLSVGGLLVLALVATSCDRNGRPLAPPRYGATHSGSRSNDGTAESAVGRGSHRTSERYWEVIERGEVPDDSPVRVALLVGCTKYYRKDLHRFRDLQGPANDVALMRRVLVDRFGFPPSHVVELSESAGGHQTPTREHIRSAFVELAKMAQQYGDQLEIVVLLSGHGSHQPDNDGDVERDFEPDGLDETFLPADIGRWDAARRTVANAIVDDDLRRWSRAITDAGAFLWVIVDACHSGTMLRGSEEDEIVRHVLPEELGVPAEEMAEASRGNRSVERRGERETGQWEVASGSGEFVAVYAAQPHELAPERRPYNSDDTRRFGLLTYTVCSILAQAATPLTYRELVSRVRRQYLQWGRRMGPTPLVEGPAQNRFVLGAGRRRPAWTLSQHHGGSGWQVDAGQLHGMSRGTILEVFPPPGSEGADQAVGYVEVVSPEMFTSRVRPVAYGGKDEPGSSDLHDGARCRIAFIDYGDLKLKVTVDQTAVKGISERERAARERRVAELVDCVRRGAERPGSIFRWVDTMEEAVWVVQLRQGRSVLLPAEAAALVDPLPEDVPVMPLESSKLEDDLTAKLQRIARAQNLVSLAATFTERIDSLGTSDTRASVDIRMFKLRDKSDRSGTRIADHGEDIELRHGERVVWEISNTGSEVLDVCLLFIDSRFGIEPVFPRPNRTADNRLAPGQSVRTTAAWINAYKSSGVEHVVAIATVAREIPVDFTVLLQPTLETVRGSAATGSRTPLGQLLLRACHAESTTRGLDMDDVTEYQMKLLYWHVLSPGSQLPMKKGDDG